MTRPLSHPSLLDLARRCEEATGPDRELDLAIAVALEHDFGTNPTHRLIGKSFAKHRAEHGYEAAISAHAGWLDPPAAYTSSVDAALLLVPEGWGWQVRWNRSGDGDEIYGNAQVWPLSSSRDEAPRNWASAATPALALTSACLKAHHALKEQE